MKQGETLALNERIMLSLVSTGVSDTFTSANSTRRRTQTAQLISVSHLYPLHLFFSLQDCPFIVCMTYAFHTPDKLCFILDLMNGK